MTKRRTRRPATRNATEGCERVLANLSRYLDGELGSEACTTLKRHCRSCARCAAVVADLERTVGLCHRAGEQPLPKAVRARAHAAVRRLLSGG